MALVKDILTLDGNAWIEIAAAFGAYFVLSFLWWGPLFGRTWGRLMGMDMDQKPDFRSMAAPLGLQVVASFLLAFVFWHVVSAFTVETDAAAMTNPTILTALEGAFYMWLGFVVPFQLGRVGWERMPWALFAINAGGQLVGLAAMGLVFALL